MADLAATFRRPFAEQVAAWQLRMRELRPTWGSADHGYSGHGRAFMVAGATKADLLADLAAAVDRAIVDGTGFEAFKTDFRAIVAQRGWHGWTGEGTARGEEWRMRTIYRTNMRTSYMAGRHAQLVDGNYRWWVYRHSGAPHPRLDHLSWDGVALPPDHPFWATHYPPNGWGCGCIAEGARTEAGIRRMGGDPGKQLPDGWQTPDPRTGLPPGIGKGWGEPPDADRARDISAAMSQKAAQLPMPLADDLKATVDALSGPRPSVAEAVASISEALGEDGAEWFAGMRRRAAGFRHVALNDAEALALHAWTDGGTFSDPRGPGGVLTFHQLLNQHLRARSQGQAGYGPAVDRAVEVVRAALLRMPPTPGTAVRGITEPTATFVGRISRVLPGDVVSFEAFTAASETAETAFSGAIRVVIQGHSGRNIAALSGLKHEREVLFPPGLHYIVKARTERDGVLTLWIEELRRHRMTDLPQEARFAQILA